MHAISPPSPSARLDALALRSSRVLLAITAITFPAFGFLARRGGFQEDIRLRLPIVAVVLLALAGSYVSANVRKGLRWWLVGLVYLITAHDAYLLVVNQLNSLLIVASLVLMSGFIATASYTLTDKRQLAAYLVFANLCMGVACACVTQPATSPLLLASAHLTLTLFAYVAVNNQMTILKELVQSRELLQRDIERREEVEARLRASERKAQSLLEAIPDVLLRVDRAGTVLEVSNQRPQGRDAVVAVTENEALSRIAESSAKLRLDSALAKAFVSGDVVSTSCSVRGTERRQHAEVRAIATSADEALVVVRDVTREKAFEERLRTSDRLVALGTLAGGIAHEINNPLSYVSGNISYALEEFQNRADGKADVTGAVTALHEARDGAERIGNIVAALKQFTEPEADKLGSVDVNDVVHSALRMSKSQLSHTELTLELASVPKVQANASRLLQVVLNLLTNAVQALPDRPKHQNRVWLKTSAAGPLGVLLEVRDNGCGIPRDRLTRIFDPFYTTKMQSVSTGLGLYLCQRFVTSFGGTLSVESVDGNGATFRVALAPMLAGTKAPQNGSAPTTIPLRLLIVDDEPLVARSVARMLRDYSSTIAGGGAEALALCAQRDFDMILCDMMMPGMDGSEFFAALRDARPELLDRVIFMTGGAFTDQATSFLANHKNRWLQKPVRREWLLDAAAALQTESMVTRCAHPLAAAPPSST
ncbi:MAG TPA: ATP-binding protein [Polyangiaceae bacterium]